MSSNIVLAKELKTGKIRLFLEYKTDKETTYRNYKIRIRRWGRKYGPYNTIRKEEGEAMFIDAGKLDYNVEVLKIVEKLDHRNVGVGYRYADKFYK